MTTTVAGVTGGDARGRKVEAPKSRRAAWVRRCACAVLALLLVPAPSSALILLSFESVPGAVPLSGSGSATGTLNFGTVSAFAPVPSGVTRAASASSYTLSTRFGVRVTRVVSLSATYTLQARLVTAQTLTWRVDGVPLSTVAATVATAQPFGTTVAHTVDFNVPFSHAAGPVATVLEVTAIAN